MLRPRVAALAAKDLWDEEQGMIPPERRAYLELVSWGCRPSLRPPLSRMHSARRSPRSAQGGRIALDWCVDFALMLVMVVGMLQPMWLVWPGVCLLLLWAGVLDL